MSCVRTRGSILQLPIIRHPARLFCRCLWDRHMYLSPDLPNTPWGLPALVDVPAPRCCFVDSITQAVAAERETQEKKEKKQQISFPLSDCRGTARPRQMTPRRDVLGRMRPWHRPLRWSSWGPMADSWRAQKPTSSAEPLGQFPPEWMAAGLDVESWTATICAVFFSDKRFVCAKTTCHGLNPRPVHPKVPDSQANSVPLIIDDTWFEHELWITSYEDYLM